MRWDSYYRKYCDKEALKTSLVGAYRPAFAWWPKHLKDGTVVWLEDYYKVYVRIPITTMCFGGIAEEYHKEKK